MNQKLCIIADDLTGAGDTGIQYQKAGHIVYLSLNAEFNEIPDDADVVIINSDSRFLNREESYKRVFDYAKECKVHGFSRFYKKIDSTLRGNLKEEIDAILDATDCSAAIISPSAPDNDRTVKNGHCYIGDLMIHDSESGRDVLNPVFSSYIPDHFKSDDKNNSILLSVDDLQKPLSMLKEMIRKFVSEGKRYIICDAVTKKDLEAVSVLKSIENLLLVGSSGLADLLAGEKENTELIKLDKPVTPERLLIINGSRMDVSRKQTDLVIKNRNVYMAQIVEKNIVNDSVKELEQTKDIIARRMDKTAVLVQTSAVKGNEKSLGLKEERRLAESISTFIGDLVRNLFMEKQFDAVVVIGGDTSTKIMKALNVEGVEYLGEVLPGIPFANLHSDFFYNPIYFISKSGGFGTPETLEQLFDFITGKDIYGENNV